MLMFPLGLPGALRIFPFATCLLVLLTCFWSIKDFENHFLQIESELGLRRKYQLSQKHQDLLLDLCRKDHSQDTQSCESLAKGKLSGKLASWLNQTTIKIEANKDPELKANELYQAYHQALISYQNEKTQHSRELGQLMRGNVSILSATRALLQHAGWAHLLGNMLILLSFSFYLEKRVGALALTMIYYLGGLAGNLIQVPFLSKAMPLLGASGCVSAVIGAFAFYFWRERIRVLVSFLFVFNKTISIPAALYISLFFVLNDFVGLMENSQVAHLAHLGGFGSGLLMAALYAEIKPLPEHFIFQQEYNRFLEATLTEDVHQRLEKFRLLSEENPDNYFAFSKLFSWLQEKGIRRENLTAAEWDFVGKIIGDALSSSNSNNQIFRFNILNSIPDTWDLKTMNFKFNILEMRRNLKLLQQQGFNETAMRLDHSQNSQGVIYAAS